MKFVNEGHLGGYVAADEQYPNGDPLTYTPAVWEYLLNRYPFKHVVDVGCGEGHAVRWFMRHPQDFTVMGIEGCTEAFAAIDAPVNNMTLHDFTSGPPRIMMVPDMLVWCCEFVEHVEEKFSDNFLQVFRQASVVAMTHAFPGQPGHHHVNCQPTEYWLARMKAIGFSLDHVTTAEARAVAPQSHWERSGLVFLADTLNLPMRPTVPGPATE